ncbi:MAG: ATP-binding cassette domain-containing protein [Cyclobacteriaceae bacterium]
MKDINIEVPKQSIFGLLGPNGAGKTTLIRIITQIIFADTGKVHFDGREINEEDVRKMGYLPEERGLYKKMKVGEHLIYLARLKGLSHHDALKKIRYWLNKFQILDWTNKRIEDLSKGMQQKIQFIATIIHDPSLIILDEPFSGFDPINVNIIKDEILELKNKGATIIFSTHRMESVEELCDHIALINKSNVILNGSKHEIKQNHRTNTYVVDYSGEFRNTNGEFQITDQSETEEGYIRSTIRITNDQSPNDLLSLLLNEVEIHSFQEKIPTMNDIFISKVNEGNNA